MQVTKSSSQDMGRTTASTTAISLSQGVALVAVLILFFAATFVAFTQSPRITVFQPPTLSEHLFYPWETNAVKRLPIIIGNLNDVFILPDSQLVWVVGDGGMILHSKDGGITWEQQDYPVDGSRKKAAAPPQNPVDRLSLFPHAMAGVEEDPKAQYSNMGDTKQSPIQKGVESASSSEPQSKNEYKAPNPTSQTIPELEPMVQNDKLPDLDVVYFEDAKTGVVLTKEGMQLGTSDGGTTWIKEFATRQLVEKASESATGIEVIYFEAFKRLAQKGVTDSDLNAIGIFTDKSWLLVGSNGLIAKSNDGETWYPLSRGTFLWLGAASLSEEKLLAENESTNVDRYRRFPAPWYWLICCLVILYGISFVARKREDDAHQQEESIADLLAPDRPLRPGDPDPLGYNSIACGLSRFMRNPSTEPPLTLAITGAWGSGKSSLMNLLYHDLKKFGFTPVWFNAWHHQKGEQLLASLYANIRNQAIPGLFSFSQLIPVGLLFRINLLFRRGVKHWLMTVVLIGVFAASATYLFTHGESSRLNVNNITGVLVAPDFSWETLLIALFGNVAPLLALLQALRAFGLNPLNLMTAQSDRQAQRQVDPSARQQFAREFNDVAKSLSLGRMVIFIDDLDRCSKENVVDILEAINFLSVSGDCYIVLGMDETWVKICIDEHFKEMSEDRPDFSDQYLEKMINIKVPVPQLSDADSSNLLVWELPDTEHNHAPAVVQLGRSLKRWVYSYRYFLLMMGVVILGGCFGLLIDSVFRPEPKSPSPQQTIATWNNIDINQLSVREGNPNFTLSVQEHAVSTSSSGTESAWTLSLITTEDDLEKGIVLGKVGNENASAALILKRNKSAQAIAGELEQKNTTRNSQSQKSLFHIGQHDNAYSDYWLPLLVGILLALGVVVYAMKMPVRRPKDSAEFKMALEIWKPWILLNRQTPRAIKRYLNRVRYMSMRYRTEPEVQSPKLGEALLNLFRKRDADETASASNTKFEANLVALSAIQAVDTPWAANVLDIDNVELQGLHNLVANKFGEQAANSENATALKQKLWDAVKKHQQKFGGTVIADSVEQERFATILTDMKVK